MVLLYSLMKRDQILYTTEDVEIKILLPIKIKPEGFHFTSLHTDTCLEMKETSEPRGNPAVQVKPHTAGEPRLGLNPGAVRTQVFCSAAQYYTTE